MAEYYSIIYIHHIFFILPHLDCFQVLVIVNSDVMNVGELYLFYLVFFFLLVRYTEAKLLNCMVVLLLVLFRNLPTISRTTFLPTVHEVPFSTSLPTFVILCVFFNNSHSQWHEIFPYCFGLHFPDD